MAAELPLVVPPLWRVPFGRQVEWAGKTLIVLSAIISTLSIFFIVRLFSGFPLSQEISRFLLLEINGWVVIVPAWMCLILVVGAVLMVRKSITRVEKVHSAVESDASSDSESVRKICDWIAHELGVAFRIDVSRIDAISPLAPFLLLHSFMLDGPYSRFRSQVLAVHGLDVSKVRARTVRNLAEVMLAQLRSER